MPTRPSPSTEARLADYRRKRQFDRTPEPTGGSAGDTSLGEGRGRFVVQRHRASRLHYDLRFEADGVLVSWAVPKGPTLDPNVRRMAMHVEDHPLEYLDFEGVIPAGEYGGGDVIVWDTGTYAADVDPTAAVAAGELHVDVAGHKLRGRFALIRRGHPADGGSAEQWLLVHKHDDAAVVGWDPEAYPRSVLSGRTNDEVLADPRLLWRSDQPASHAAVDLRAGELQVSDDELMALERLDKDGTWEVFGRRLRLTNLDKVLFPAKGDQAAVTKRDLVRYAAHIGPTLVPYVRGRAMNLRRHPDGAARAGFWHKELPGHAPAWLARWENPDADPDETRTYLVMDEPAAVVWAANFGALEWHAWTSRTGSPHCPSYALIDIDPGTATSWQDVLLLARLHRDALAHLRVRGYPKVTGHRGVQIWVPIRRGPSFAQTRAWVEGLSKAVGAVVPELVSWKWGVEERAGLARLDYTQNAINRTLVAPYSPRARPGAPVSAPIGWHELDDPDLRPDAFTIRTVLDRLREHGDLFRGATVEDQVLPQL